MDPNIQKMMFKYRHFTQTFLVSPNLKQEAFKYFLSHFFGLSIGKNQEI